MKAMTHNGSSSFSWSDVPDPQIQHPEDVIVRGTAVTPVRFGWIDDDELEWTREAARLDRGESDRTCSDDDNRVADRDLAVEHPHSKDVGKMSLEGSRRSHRFDHDIGTNELVLSPGSTAS